MRVAKFRGGFDLKNVHENLGGTHEPEPVAEQTDTARATEAQLRAMLNALPAAIFATDAEGRLTDYNRATFELAYRAPRIGADRWCPSWKLYHADGTPLPHEECTLAVALRENREIRGPQIIAERPDGSRVWLEPYATPLRDASGNVIGAIDMLVDITEAKRAESELIAAKRAAERANVAKSDFLSSMSHELRTPLSAILGFAQLMESSTPEPTLAQKRNIEQILRSGWYLLDLINEILDLAVIESGKLTLLVEPQALNDLLLECRGMVEPRAQKRGIRLTFPSADTVHHINADRTRVKQVLINLLSNAIKYNKADGSVVLDYALTAQGRIRISVTDSGIGLSPEQMAQLFQPFNRLGQETGSEEGNGIGLVVSKRLVELMGGVIGAESELGSGSSFWIELDRVEARSPNIATGECPVTEAESTETAAQPRTLLYVEDNPAHLMLVEELIARRPNLKLLCASDGLRGVEIARESRPDVILMDINLPGLSGLQALAKLRGDPRTAHIPVIALSAHAMPHDIKNGLDAGFFCYLTKPAKVQAVMAALDEAFKHAGPATESALSPVR